MASAADDAEAAAAGAVDSDGSVSWEEFFGKPLFLLFSLQRCVFGDNRGSLCCFDEQFLRH